MVIAVAATVIANAIGVLFSLIVAVILGVLVGNTMDLASARPGMQWAATRLLRFGVVLIGLRVALGDLIEIGLPGLVIVLIAVTSTFFGAQWLGRRLEVSRDLSLLIGTGYSICGVSAVVAAAGVIGADEEETAYAVGLVTLAGSLSIMILPLGAGVLGMSDAGFGTWVGGAVHDVAQAVATASTRSDAALAAAIVVKLTRVALLAPLVIGVSLQRRTRSDDTAPERPPLVPLFVAGFLLMVLVRSTGIIPAEWLGRIRQVEACTFTVSLVAVGFGVELARLRKLGGRPLALGMATWVLVAGMSYLGVVITR